MLLGICRPPKRISQQTTIVYAKFGGQTECIMDDCKIENLKRLPALVSALTCKLVPVQYQEYQYDLLYFKQWGGEGRNMFFVT